jgi:hypothetical protein
MLSNSYIFDRLGSDEKAYVSGIIPPEMLQFYALLEEYPRQDHDLYSLSKNNTELYRLALAIAMPTLTYPEIEAFAASLKEDAKILMME